MAISKIKQGIAKQVGISEKTCMKYFQLADLMKRMEQLVGKEVFDLFHQATGTKFSADKLLKANKLDDNTLRRFIRDSIMFPDCIEDVYDNFIDNTVKVTVEISKDTNKLVTEKAKKLGMSRKQYIEWALKIVSKIKQE